MTSKSHGTHHRAEVNANSLEYRALYGMVYVLCLGTAIIRRLVPGRENTSNHDHNAVMSLFLEARAATASIVPYVFQV